MARSHNSLLPARFVLDIDRGIVSTSPVTNDYTNDLVEALRSLAQMLTEREKLEIGIAKQKKKVAALRELVAVDNDSPPPTDLVEGLTDACRTVFRAAEKPLWPLQVKTRVQALGLPPQQNLLASVHTVIRRLLAANEIEEVNPPSGGGPIAYQWKPIAAVLPHFMRVARGLAHLDSAEIEKKK